MRRLRRRPVRSRGICGDRAELVNARNSCCDKGSAELGEHVFEGGVVLVGVPGLVGAAAGEVVGVVAVQRVPDDDEAVRRRTRTARCARRALQPVAGLADAEQLFADGDGGLDRPLSRGSDYAELVAGCVARVAVRFRALGIIRAVAVG